VQKKNRRKKERKNMKMKTMLGEREKFGGDVWWYINWIHMQAKLSVYLNLVKCIYST
jgi:hypothetical protein